MASGSRDYPYGAPLVVDRIEDSGPARELELPLFKSPAANCRGSILASQPMLPRRVLSGITFQLIKGVTRGSGHISSYDFPALGSRRAGVAESPSAGWRGRSNTLSPFRHPVSAAGRWTASFVPGCERPRAAAKTGSACINAVFRHSAISIDSG